MSKVVFFRIGWMKNYIGSSAGDRISGGGSWPDKGELFNFASVRGHHFGYVQPPANATGLNLPRVDEQAAGSKVTDVTVIWLANRPGGGSFVVGWYRKATVYAKSRPAPASAARKSSSGQVPYYATARAADSRLLELDERLFEVPRGKGFPGRSNVFYADANPAFAAEVLRYIQTGRIGGGKGKGGGKPRQSDIFKRQAVAKAAISMTAEHYQRLHYHVDSVEADNVGWDLTATSGRTELHLEVKGLSGSVLVAELTPNEYRYLMRNSPSYRLCIVTNALTAPQLNIFSYDNDAQNWSSASGKVLQVDEILSARVAAR